VRPGWKSTDEQQDQDDQEDRAEGHADTSKAEHSTLHEKGLFLDGSYHLSHVGSLGFGQPDAGGAMQGRADFPPEPLFTSRSTPLDPQVAQ
jgi:hypothetical protein